VRTAANEQMTYARDVDKPVQEIRDNFRHLLFIAQTRRDIALTLVISNIYGSTDRFGENKITSLIAMRS